MNNELRITESLIEVPSNPAITLAYARDHIQALTTLDDGLIEVWIAAATSYFEEQTGRPIITQVREAWLDSFPFVGAQGMAARIELPNPPLQEVLFVQYVNEDGDVVDFDDGTSPTVNLWTQSAPQGPYAKRGIVEPLFGVTWPTARLQSNAVRIRYRCGYGDSMDDVPELVRGIVCYLVGHFDTFRSAVVEARNGQILELPLGVQQMMDGFKFSAFPTQKLTTGGYWPFSGMPWPWR